MKRLYKIRYRFYMESEPAIFICEMGKVSGLFRYQIIRQVYVPSGGDYVGTYFDSNSSSIVSIEETWDSGFTDYMIRLGMDE